MMKPTLVMIGGTLCNELLFRPQIKYLSGMVNCKVVCNHSADNLSQIAKNIMTEIKGNFFLMGLSFGGIISFEILRQSPERVKKLILLNTNHKLPSNETVVNNQRLVGMGYLGEFDKITSDILIDKMLYPQNAKNMILRKVIMKMAKSIGFDNFVKQIKAQLKRPDSTIDLGRIKIPTLIITGKQDIVCPVALHQEMAELIPVSTLKIINKCGHLSSIERPNEVNKIIKKWLITA